MTPEVAGEVGERITGDITGESTPQVIGHVAGEATPRIRLIRAMSGEMTGRQLREALNLSDIKYFRSNCLLPALHDGLIEMTIPDKPRSSRQRYRLTPAGSEYLKRIGDAR